jgi:hypothetical protein
MLMKEVRDPLVPGTQLKQQTFGGSLGNVSNGAAVLSVSISGIVCNADGSATAYGLVTDINANLQAWMTDQSGNPVGQCVRIVPVPSGLPGPPDWAYTCTGFPAGQTVNFFIKATNASGASSQSATQFQCAAPAPGSQIVAKA